MADKRVTDLPELLAPVPEDIAMVVDVSDKTDSPSGSSRRATLQRYLGVLHSVCDCRLSLIAGVPFPDVDTPSASTLRMVPARGNAIGLWDGFSWGIYTFTEQTTPLAIASGSNYDVFAYVSSGVVTFQLGQAWTNDTTRATALLVKDGVEVLSSDPTRRYLGTIRGSGPGTTCDTVNKRFCYSHYNRIPRMLTGLRVEPHTYTTGAWRAWGGNLANVSLSWVQGNSGQLGGSFRSVVTGSAGNQNVGANVNATNGPGGFNGQQLNNPGDCTASDVYLAPAGYSYFTCVQFGGSPSGTYDRISYSVSWQG